MGHFVASTRDALVTAINSASPAFTGSGTGVPIMIAEAIYDIYTKMETLPVGSGQIVVVPKTKKLTLMTRGGTLDREITIDVAVQYHFAQPIPSELDHYLALAENICEYFARPPNNQLSNGAIVVDGSEHPHLWVDDHMREKNVFTSVISLTFTTKN
jgi:hypothetical protein